MHRDVVSAVCVTATNFILTTSVDGHLKFWKKTPPAEGEAGIEFVKHFRAHLAPILACVASVDGLVAATLAADGSVGEAGGQGSIKVFDIENFGERESFPSAATLTLIEDMINMITLTYVPLTACWVHGKSEAQILLAV